MKNNILLSILIGLFYSCTPTSKESEEATTQNEKPTVLVVDEVNYNKSYGSCESDTSAYCTTVVFNYPKFVGGDSMVTEKINHSLKEQILRNYLKDSTSSTIEDYANQFIEDYKTIKSKFESSFGWENQLETTIVRQDSNLVVLETAIEMYTGGAHGSNSLYYLNYDLKTGQLLTLDDVFKAGYENQLNNAVKVAFEHKAAGDNNYLETFEFEDNQYYNTNFGLLNDGIHFYYNVYEIAPYSSGVTSIIIPYSEVESIFTY